MTPLPTGHFYLMSNLHLTPRAKRSPHTPAAPLVLTLSAVPFFHLLKPKTLKSSMTLLLLSHPTSNSFANPVISSSKMYLESSHIFQPLQSPPWFQPLHPYWSPAWPLLLPFNLNSAARVMLSKLSSGCPTPKMRLSSPTTVHLSHAAPATMASLLFFKTSGMIPCQDLGTCYSLCLNSSSPR